MFHSMNTSKEDTKPESSWRVEEPDEAKYNFSDEKGVWQPAPKEILRLFQELANGDPLPLKWTCPGRRPPQKDTNTEENVTEGNEEDEDESMEEETKAPETSAFDFDEPHMDMNNSVLIPRRAPGGIGRTPRTEKRVARMDNIMNSLQKQQMQRAAEREARKVKGLQSGTPPSRSRLLNFGSLAPKRLNAGSDSPGRGTPPASVSGNTAVSTSPTVSGSATTSDTLTHIPASNTPAQATGNEPKLQGSSTMLPSTTAAPLTSTSDNTLNPPEQTAPGKNTSLTTPTATTEDGPDTAISDAQENTTSTSTATISNTLQTSQSNATGVVSANPTPTPATSSGLTTAPQSVVASSTETVSQSGPLPSVSAPDSKIIPEATDAPHKTVSSSIKPPSSDSADQNQLPSGAEDGAKPQLSTASSNSDQQESSKPSETTGPEADKSVQQDPQT